MAAKDAMKVGMNTAASDSGAGAGASAAIEKLRMIDLSNEVETSGVGTGLGSKAGIVEVPKDSEGLKEIITPNPHVLESNPQCDITRELQNGLSREGSHDPVDTLNDVELVEQDQLVDITIQTSPTWSRVIQTKKRSFQKHPKCVSQKGPESMVIEQASGS
ncbi:phosphoribosylaminoimidazole carboxylase ATPase subunit [Striga asiatica]|uniref:Phosphoribosylaminoimidazole carboxylase ATPase subunit n=1 Tax=Striga asiatica TaxID=4170 RepID=A0A5A7R307_STRAF|nr:phosphoribosylaminoimidazole carboxylase ATPase subunit [Striga asiatica]